MRMIEAFTYQGPQPGPHVLLLAGVAGDETPGMDALAQLLTLLNTHQLELSAGRLTIIPRANSEAAKQARAWVDEDLAHVIGPHGSANTHEKKLAGALIPYLEAADWVLDLHACNQPTAAYALPQDNSEPARQWAEALGLDYALYGWPTLLADSDRVSPVEYAWRKEKQALTVFSGAVADPQAVPAALRAALNTLALAGLIGPQGHVRKPRLLRLTHIIHREQEGWLVGKWKNFEYVKAGTVVARYDDGTAITSDHNGYIILPQAHARRGDVWFYLAAALDAPGAGRAG